MDILVGKESCVTPLYGYRDTRMEKRLQKVNGIMKNADLSKSFPDIIKNKHQLKAFYRLVSYQETKHDNLLTYYNSGAIKNLQPHKLYFKIQDTTELVLDKFVKGAGLIGHGNSYGAYLHSGLVVDSQGIPLFLAHQQIIVRSQQEHGKKYQRQQRVFEDKESFKWAEGIISGYAISKEQGCRLCHVMDREGDCTDVMKYSFEYEQHFIIRSYQDRNVEHNANLTKAWDTDKYDNYDFQYRDIRIDHKKVCVKCRLSWQELHVHGLKQAIYGVYIKSIEIGINIEWLLLTDIQVTKLDDALFVVNAYKYRWLIEDFHKCLKTGCKVESRRFADIDTYMNALTIIEQHALDLLRLQVLSELEPDKNLTDTLSATACQVLLKLSDKHLYPSEKQKLTPYTVLWVLTIIANMGGYRSGKNRKAGWQVLWRGYQKYLLILEGYQMTLKSPNST